MKIAQAHATQGKSDDWTRASGDLEQADFAQKAPGLDWSTFFKAAQLDGQAEVRRLPAGRDSQALSALVAVRAAARSGRTG